MVEMRSEKSKDVGREEPWAKPVRMVYKESGMGHVRINGDGRAEKPRYGVPQGVGVKTGTRLS